MVRKLPVGSARNAFKESGIPLIGRYLKKYARVGVDKHQRALNSPIEQLLNLQNLFNYTCLLRG